MGIWHTPCNRDSQEEMIMRKLNTIKRSILFVALFLLSVHLLPLPAIAGTATDQIQATVNKVISILKDPQWNSKGRRAELRNQLKQVIYRRFDFNQMARRSLGRQWGRITPAERNEFTRLFTDLLERTYVNQIQGFNDERVVFTRERSDGNYAEVESRILTRTGKQFSVNYKSLLVDGEWKIYDIVAENISLVNNYRSQFRRILARSSYKELIRRIRQKL